MRALLSSLLLIGLTASCYSVEAELLPLHPHSNAAIPISVQIQSLQTTITLQEQLLQQTLNSLVQNKLRLLQLQTLQPAPESSHDWLSGNSPNVLTQAFVAGANQTDKIYICQASLYGNLYPGELTAQGCLLTYAGAAETVLNYTLLSNSKPYAWLASNQFSQNPSLQAVKGGYENGHPVDICRVTINQRMQVGKVVSGNCNIAVNQREASWPDYKVLVIPPLLLAPGPVILPGPGNH